MVGIVFRDEILHDATTLEQANLFTTECIGQGRDASTRIDLEILDGSIDGRLKEA